VTNEEIVRRFEEEFKNQANFDIVDELMAEDFVHHMPFPHLPPGRTGMRAVGTLVFGAIRDIRTSVALIVSEGDLVADRIDATGVRNDTAKRTDWNENHIYRVSGGRIVELWPAGGPDLS
jgi:ketosteroid isomerase-like protein